MELNSLEKIEALLEQPFFSASDAAAYGVHPRVLAYYCDKGMLERISRGVYRKAGRDSGAPIQWEDVAYTAATIPNGIICLITALSYHGLTDEIPRQIWIAVPRSSWPPKRDNTKIVRISDNTLGVEEVYFGEIPARIFDRERTIVDSFRLLSREVAIKALRRYLTTTEKNKPDLPKLRHYAKKMRTDITPYIETLTT